MNTSKLIINFFGNVLLTAFVYLFVPIIIVISKKKFTEKEIKRIVIFNGVGGYILFTALHLILQSGDIANVLATVFWSGIVRSILRRTSFTTDEPTPRRIVVCKSCGYRDLNTFKVCPQCGKRGKRYERLSKKTLFVDDKICFCRKCGEKLIDSSKFCGKCGTEIIEEIDGVK